MKRRMFLFAIILLLTAAAGAQEIGRGVITALEGEAEKRQAPEADWRPPLRWISIPKRW